MGKRGCLREEGPARGEVNLFGVLSREDWMLVDKYGNFCSSFLRQNLAKGIFLTSSSIGCFSAVKLHLLR